MNRLLPGIGGRVGYLCSVAVAAFLAGCSGGAPAKKTADGGTGSGGNIGGTSGTGGSSGTGGRGGSAGGSGGQSGASAGAGGAGVQPTVVATFDQVPISLALDGANLYVTVGATVVGDDGKVQTLPKTALGATSGGGGITTLASGLREPSTIAVTGAKVYWLGIDIVSGNPEIFAVPTTGGSVAAITTGYTYTGSRMAIANSVLYAILGNFYIISAFPLTGSAAGVGQVIYTGPAFSVLGADSDGTSVFFFSRQGDATPIHIYQIPVGGSAVTDLVKDVGSGQEDCDLIDDATTIYWSNPSTHGVYSVPKTGGTPKLLANFPNTGGFCPEIALDGNDIYALIPLSLSRFPKSGGTPVTLASPPVGVGYVLSTADSAVALAIDDTYVYWLSKKTGQILKLAK